MVLVLWGIRRGLYLLFEAVMAIDWYGIILKVVFALAFLVTLVLVVMFPAIFQWLDFLCWFIFSVIDIINLSQA